MCPETTDSSSLTDSPTKPIDYAKKDHLSRAPQPISAQCQKILTTLAILIPAPICVFWAIICTRVMRDYGWTLFVGSPFMTGALAVGIDGWYYQRSITRAFRLGATACTAWLGLFLVFGLDGLGCIIMALPVAVPIGGVGGVAGHFLVRFARPYRPSRLLPLIVAAIPATAWIEHQFPSHSAQYSVTTSIDVNAPAAAVWQHVIRFPDIPQPQSGLFTTGLAYPVRARINGTGPGATRYCEFSTGDFVEPIEIWDEPHLLKFSVTNQPVPMREWSPWGNIQPPHLHGYFASREGQFRLVALPDGRTRIEGTTWYQNAMSPQAYWQLWSDYILHRIHGRVLEHIKRESESRIVAEAVSRPVISRPSERNGLQSEAGRP